MNGAAGRAAADATGRPTKPLRIAFAIDRREDVRLLLPVADALASSPRGDEGSGDDGAAAVVEIALAAVGREARESLLAAGRAHESPDDSDWFFAERRFDLIVMPLAPAERGGLFRYIAREAARRGVPTLSVEGDVGRSEFDAFPGRIAVAGGASYSRALLSGWDAARVAVTGSPLFDATPLVRPRERGAADRCEGTREIVATGAGGDARSVTAPNEDERAFWSAELAGVARPRRALIVSSFAFAGAAERAAFSEGIASGLAAFDGAIVEIAASIGGRDVSSEVADFVARLRSAGVDARALPGDAWHDRIAGASAVLTDDLVAGLLALSGGAPLVAIAWAAVPAAPGASRPPTSPAEALHLPAEAIVSPERAGCALREAIAGARPAVALDAGSARERVRGFVEPGPPSARERTAALALHLAVEGRARRDAAQTRVLAGNERLVWGRPREAEASYRDALAADPAHAGALANLGLVLAARGDDREALDCFGRALDLEPGDLATRLAAARLLARAGEPFAAASLLEEVAAAPADRRVLLALAEIYAGAGLPEQAVAFFDAAAGIGVPNDAERAARAISASIAGIPSSSSARGGATAPPRLSIVIVTFNEIAYTRKCVASIVAHTPDPYEIVFVDNGSTDGTPEWLATVPGARVLRNATNLGFAAAANQGIRAAAADRIVLLNNDVVLTEGWLAGLARHLERDPRVGLVGPVSNYVSGAQLDPTAAYESVLEMEEHARRTARERRGQSEEARRLVGFCLLARAQVFREVGLFDERFALGNFEDDDLCVRAALAGWRLVIAKDVFVHHYGSRTFLGNRINYREALERNKAYFLEKWRGVVAAAGVGNSVDAAGATSVEGAVAR